MLGALKIFTSTALLCQLSSAITCDSSIAGSCQNEEDADETSLVQVKKLVKFGSERSEPVVPDADEEIPTVELTAGTVEAEEHQIPIMMPGMQNAFPAGGMAMAQPVGLQPGYPMAGSPFNMAGPAAAAAAGAVAAGAVAGEESMADETLPQMLPGGGIMTGYPGAGQDDFHVHQSMSFSSQSGPAPESPRRAAVKAQENERLAARAMRNAVHRAHDEERAANFAAKKAAELRAAAERAAAAENQAAQSEMAAADSAENAAVRKAAADRTHAKAAAVKAVVQKAAAYQASADQQAAAQRAAAARTAAETASNGIHDGFQYSSGREYSRVQEREDLDGDGGFRNQRFDRDDDEYYDGDGDDGYDGDDDGYGYRDGDGDDGDGYYDDEHEHGYYGAHEHGHHRYGRYNDRGRGRWHHTCHEFECPRPYTLRLQSHDVRCNHRHGCSTEDCCLKPPQDTCTAFMCPPPMALRLQPESLMCQHEGCTPDRCCLQGQSPINMCNVGDAVVATWQGDGRQYRGEISSQNPDGTVSINWLDDDTTYPTVPANQVFKNDQPCGGGAPLPGAPMVPGNPMMPGMVPPMMPGMVPPMANPMMQANPMMPVPNPMMPNPMMGAVAPAGFVGAETKASEGIQLTSDGSKERPHCSWHTDCHWDSSTQEDCASALCKAAGHTGGKYVSASNNMCTHSFTNKAFKYYSADTKKYTSSLAGKGNEAQITATCKPDQAKSGAN